MAVSLNSNSSYRADFMISDAAVSQRTGKGQVKQDDGFAKLLDSRSGEKSKPTGSVNSSDSISSASTYEAPEPKAELERVCEVPDKESLVVESSEKITLVREDKAVDIPEDTMELARQIVSGEIDLDDVPLDKLTFELLKAIVVVKKLEVSKDDDSEEPSVFDPEMQFAMQDNVAMTLEMQILPMISLILEVDSEESLLAKVEGIGEMMAENLPEVEIPMAEETFEFTQSAESSQAAAEQGAEVPKSAEQLSKSGDVKPAENASTSDVSEGKVVVRKITQSEQTADNSQQEGGEQNASYNRQSSISKEISEELEMLRNAKLGKAKTESVQTGEVGKSGKADEAVPVHTANPLNADAPIVMAGKDGEMIQIRPSEVMSQVTKIVEQAIAENKEQTEYSMVLNPEELGRITVKLVKAADGAVSVTIVAENASTQRLLEQNGELMQSNLRANGVQLQSWQTVNEAHQETMQREYDGSSKNPYYREENENPDDEQSEGESFADIIAAM